MHTSLTSFSLNKVLIALIVTFGLAAAGFQVQQTQLSFNEDSSIMMVQKKSNKHDGGPSWAS